LEPLGRGVALLLRHLALNLRLCGDERPTTGWGWLRAHVRSHGRSQHIRGPAEDAAGEEQLDGPLYI
jgi:hypothetical protein